MITVDNKIVYNLFCNKLLLQYLDNKERSEFSSTCKFIFQSCTRFRLSSYRVNSLDFEKSIKDKNVMVKSFKNMCNDQIDYTNIIVTKYKPYIESLVCRYNKNCYVLEHLSISFNYLRSLLLFNMQISKKNFINIIENLPNLYNLLLHQIGINLGKNEQKLVQLKFPNYLKKLVMEHCYQLNRDFEDCNSKESKEVSPYTSNRYSLDMSNLSINSIKHLVWNSNYDGNENSLNELLVNNQKLEKLQLLLNESNFKSLSLISSNRNLTRLIISTIRDISLNSIHIPQLSFIKSIEVIAIFGIEVESINPLLQNCPNLEELKCMLTVGCGNTLCEIIKSNVNLKRLSISLLSSDTLLSTPFPDSSIEHLEFTYPGRFKGNFSALANLKQLKSIKLIGGLKPSKIYDLKSQLHPNGACWRVIEYSNSILYWKIIQK
ncbi:hypothetical protein CONCODRAFT_70220 [Conidiobolus coronatus NRRL 28638]|uniref:RNI-like protein n=1 Tax=Conidiobolus coronatus (strain ATCC 28846 / CBS 209.66 / NRRL 28638) TaxID=796925 RepID=A0A137P7J6_CONC2|nr:hypothetical protein CONCODRAFT_70220 [Conidiobolus coronatus NRRL 28638]|eukprot:KXN70980.1 hypothetical protein CONCODRAFT_70220 [Conidiobolus coronatus NRRL 28638]